MTTFHNKVFFTDYRPVAQNGFFVTEANTVPFDYEPIGSMVLEQYNGYVSESGEKIKKEVVGYDDVFMDKLPEKGSKEAKQKNKYKYATAESTLEAFAEQAKMKGANGVIGIKFQWIDSKSVSGNGIVVSGMLIRRK